MTTSHETWSPPVVVSPPRQASAHPAVTVAWIYAAIMLLAGTILLSLGAGVDDDGIVLLFLGSTALLVGLITIPICLAATAVRARASLMVDDDSLPAVPPALTPTGEQIGQWRAPNATAAGRP